MHKFTTDELVAQKPKDILTQPRNPIIFILHNLRSLENVGLFFRLADAIRAEKIYLTGYTGYPRLPNDSREERIIAHAEREINKTAIKLVPAVAWESREDISGLITDLRGLKTQVVAVEQTDSSVEFTKATYHFPVALIFGHERTGIEEDILEKSDLIVNIPMLGLGNSHNVAMSAAIISYHLLQKLPV
ncbi:MAG: hypothetical protein M1484_02525 [Patescibacteria group bacterium]|nr:hypothetical protein [Patescibacteria group bacterium]MCL5431956.1 hypothetical protein [Patescibacteria group bacterium]